MYHAGMSVPAHTHACAGCAELEALKASMLAEVRYLTMETQSKKPKQKELISHNLAECEKAVERQGETNRYVLLPTQGPQQHATCS